MNIREYLDQYFGLQSTADSEGVYRYFITEEEDKMQISSSRSPKESELMIECDDSNYMALMYLVHQKPRFILEGTKISAAESFEEEKEEVLEGQAAEKAIIFYSDAWKRRYLRVNLSPSIAVAMEIDYEQYETDQEGVVIWE